MFAELLYFCNIDAGGGQLQRLHPNGTRAPRRQLHVQDTVGAERIGKRALLQFRTRAACQVGAAVRTNRIPGNQPVEMLAERKQIAL